MTKNKILIIISAVALFVVGGVAGAYIASSWLDDSTDNTDNQQSEQADSKSETETETETEVPVDDTPDQAGSQVIDGVDIPRPVLDHLEADYPDYVIEDADREVENGQVYYEIDLDHTDPANSSEYKLTYDAGWVLIDTEFDD